MSLYGYLLLIDDGLCVVNGFINRFADAADAADDAATHDLDDGFFLGWVLTSSLSLCSMTMMMMMMMMMMWEWSSWWFWMNELEHKKMLFDYYIIKL